MPDCSKCGKHLTRTHRTTLEKPFFSAAYHCRHCDSRVRVLHSGLKANLTFVFSRHTHCIKCGNAKVRRHGKRDRIDTLSNHPLSWLLRLTGAPIYRCFDCRVQYYDWRQPEPSSEEPKEPERPDDAPAG